MPVFSGDAEIAAYDMHNICSIGNSFLSRKSQSPQHYFCQDLKRYVYCLLVLDLLGDPTVKTIEFMLC